MKKIIVKGSLLSMFIICMLSCAPSASTVDVASAIVPCPVNVVQQNGRFTITSSTIIAVENYEQAAVANYFSRLFEYYAGFKPTVQVGSNGNISFITDNSLTPESYKLKVNQNKVEIAASDIRGFFYALQTLRLCLPAALEALQSPNPDWSIPAMVVSDSPRFEYRGLMLDVARYFMPLEDVKQLIDCMSMLKLNKLHLHLSDDTGWRLEIKKYPKLTDVGAWRVDRSNLPFYERRNQQPGEKATLGGFYTQEDIKDMVAYAAERQVEIIPEIDVPAHSCAALASYPELACPNVKTDITVLPGLGGRNTEIIYCAGKEETFSFLFDVIDEVAELFPSKYIHMGGDEANKFYWKSCPLCRKRMLNEGIEHVEDLQGYFMKRMNEHIMAKGKTMIGWDELTNSTVPEGTVIMGWQGFGNAALKAAEEGHRFIMTPARLLYLIRYQGPQWFEPLTYFGNNLMKDIYMYEPVQKEWKPEYADLLWGVQASMWTEFCDNTDAVMYQIFPRLAALAEVAWSQKGHKDWERFQKSLDNYLLHLDAKNVKYAKSMFNIQHKSVPVGNGVKVKLAAERTDVDIRFTIDGSEPSVNSPLYSDSLFFDSSAVLKAATFKDDEKMGQTLVLELKFNKATGKHVLGSNMDDVLLTNGVRGSLRQSDFEWCTWSNEESSFVVDLNKTEEVSNISLGCLTNYGMGVHKPKSILIEYSDDNKDFRKLACRTFSVDEIFTEGNFVENINFVFNKVKARYIRVQTEAAGVIPSFHFMRPGQVSKYYFDEITVE